MAEPDARLGLIAVQLGEVEEAKKLFASAGRPDLLNKLLQVCLTHASIRIPQTPEDVASYLQELVQTASVMQACVLWGVCCAKQATQHLA